MHLIPIFVYNWQGSTLNLLMNGYILRAHGSLLRNSSKTLPLFWVHILSSFKVIHYLKTVYYFGTDQFKIKLKCHLFFFKTP